MTCDSLTEAILAQPKHYQFTVWSRETPSHWELEYCGRAEKCEQIANVILRERPEREVLILGPGETPC